MPKNKGNDAKPSTNGSDEGKKDWKVEATRLEAENKTLREAFESNKRRAKEFERQARDRMEELVEITRRVKEAINKVSSGDALIPASSMRSLVKIEIELESKLDVWSK